VLLTTGDLSDFLAFQTPDLRRVADNVESSLVSGNDVFSGPAVAQLALFTTLPTSVKTTLNVMPAAALITFPPWKLAGTSLKEDTSGHGAWPH